MTTLPSTIQERITLPAAAGGAIGDSQVPLTAGDVLSMLRRRMVLIIFLSMVFIAAVVGGFIVWWKYYPGYRSESLIRCVSNLPEAGLTLETERLRQDDFERFLLTQSMILKSQGILREVLQVNRVRETAWHQSIQPGKHLLTLTDELSSSPVRGTNVIRVSIECRKREDATVIVDQVVGLWRERVTLDSANQYAPDLEAARQEEETLRARIEEGRLALREIAERLPAGARVGTEPSLVAQQVEQYGAQAAVLRMERDQLEQYREYYNSPDAPAVTPEDQAIIEQDPQVAELVHALVLLERQRDVDSVNFGAEHRIRKQLTAEIVAVEEKLAQLESQKLRERRAAMREATNTAYANTTHALLIAEERLARAEAALADQDRLLFDYTNLEAEVATLLEFEAELATHIKDLERIVRQRRAIDVSIAQPATEPLKRSSPSVFLLAVGVFLSVSLAVGLSLTLELLDQSVRTTQDVTRHLEVAMLGAIPDTDDEEVDIKQVATAVADEPRSMVAEAFRRLRTNLQFSAPMERQRSVLVTSPRPADGKTTVACNLAIAVAQGGRRVLLVDANFRRPALAGLLPGIGPNGLSNILVRDAVLESCVTKTDTPLLEVLGSGPAPPNPAELLGSEQCRAFLQSAMERYDQVIVDAPPVLVASDALVLATAVDGVILVIRAKANSRGAARRTCRLLADVSAHLFGAVLNVAQVTRGGYFREQLRAYYDYQAEAGPTAQPTLPAELSPPGEKGAKG